MNKARGAQIQYAAPIIDIGLHYCEEYGAKKVKGKWIRDPKTLHKFWYSYDLTTYHVSQGQTSLKALESLLFTLWASEILALEEKAKGGKVTRNRLEREHPEAIPELRRAMKKWRGVTMKGVNWRKFWPCTIKVNNRKIAKQLEARVS